MRVAVTGATGNVGVEVMKRLLADPAVTSLVGIVRRPPTDAGDHIARPSGDTGARMAPATGAGERLSPSSGMREPISWVACDVSADTAPAELTRALTGVDTVIHLAWLLQPSHRPQVMRQTNIDGTAHLLRAVEQAGVGALVHASSLGAYSPGPDKVTRVDESWPTAGVAGSLYSAQKAEAERMLDRFESGHPAVRVARIRPAVVLQRDAAAEQARYFLGRLLPARAVRRSLIPVLPLPRQLVTQVVHASDIADLFARAALDETARGAYNGAGEPALTPEVIARAFKARLVPLPASVLRVAAEATWRLRLQPTDRGWIELALRSPLLDSGRAMTDLGWRPAHTAEETFAEALAGLEQKAGGSTPVLSRDT